MGVHAVRAAARCGSPRRFGSGGGGGYRVVAALWFGWRRRLGWGGGETVCRCTSSHGWSSESLLRYRACAYRYNQRGARVGRGFAESAWHGGDQGLRAAGWGLARRWVTPRCSLIKPSCKIENGSCFCQC